MVEKCHVKTYVRFFSPYQIIYMWEVRLYRSARVGFWNAIALYITYEGRAQQQQ